MVVPEVEVQAVEMEVQAAAVVPGQGLAPTVVQVPLQQIRVWAFPV
jgi:hypothetical protein